MNKRNTIQVGSGYLEYIKKDFKTSDDYNAYIKSMDYLFIDKNNRIIREGDWVRIIWSYKVGEDSYGESMSFVTADRTIKSNGTISLAEMDGKVQSVEVLGNMHDYGFGKEGYVFNQNSS